MIEFIKVIILGIIEGVTEWLPISSTGHLILVNALMPLKIYQDSLLNKDFVDMFMVVIQLGAILAVCVIYFKKLNPFTRSKNIEERNETISLWLKVIVACIPAAVLGLLFDDIIDTYLFNNVTVSITLVIYGILFIIIENRNIEAKVLKVENLSYKNAILIGLFQCLALIPGTSRSGATILTGIILGLKRSVAAEFSFFLAIPVMFGASFLKLIKMKVAFTTFSFAILILGMVVSFVVSIIAIKFLMSYIRKNDFKVFGYYRIILGLIVLLAFFLK